MEIKINSIVEADVFMNIYTFVTSRIFIDTVTFGGEDVTTPLGDLLLCIGVS